LAARSCGEVYWLGHLFCSDHFLGRIKAYLFGVVHAPMRYHQKLSATTVQITDCNFFVNIFCVGKGWKHWLYRISID
jgi:hypothetical protein